MMSRYIAFADGLSNRRLYPENTNLNNLIKNPTHDYYKSIFFYNEDHRAFFNENKTLAGIKDVETNRLVWDFDDKDDLEQARQDALDLCTRLVEYGISPDQVQVSFSGMKGFGVEILTNKWFTPEEFKNITLALAKDLKTNDSKIAGDPQRIIRIPKTKHLGSGLYKIPLNADQLSDLPIEQITALAADPDNVDDEPIMEVDLPSSIYNLRIGTKKEIPAPSNAYDLDFKSKPRGFTNCKYAIMNGMFEEGERNNCISALAVTCRSLGYPKEITYGICKTALRLQSDRTGQAPFSKTELYTGILKSAYSDHWGGGTYSCKKEGWLKDYCEKLGPNKCKHSRDETPLLQASEVANEFLSYTNEIEKNTIKTGLVELDNKIRLTVGMPVGILGSPGSGKTSLSLNILKGTSKQGISSVFFSMDMYGPLVYMKQIQNLYGYSTDKIHEIFKHDRKHAEEIKERVKEEYKNVKFSLKAGHTVQEMRDIISEYQDSTGDKVKLVMIDYLECISGPYSDPTANSAKVAGELRDFATEMAVCNVVLLQPPKSAGDASAPLSSMRQVKGSSMLEQSFRAILGIYREGFGPNSEQDKFMTINALKNTMGPLFSMDCYWNGSKCDIGPIDDEGQTELDELRRRKKEASSSEGAF